jgi:hypothetical protein
MTRPIVTEVGLEAAVPFIEDYCRRYDLPCEFVDVEPVQWLGAWLHSGLRAVAGIRDLPGFPNDRYIYGFYGDGTPIQHTCMHALAHALVAMPWGLIGDVHLNNTRMLRTMMRHGWTIKKLHESDRTVSVYRPPLFGGTLPQTVAR